MTGPWPREVLAVIPGETARAAGEASAVDPPATIIPDACSFGLVALSRLLCRWPHCQGSSEVCKSLSLVALWS